MEIKEFLRRSFSSGFLSKKECEEIEKLIQSFSNDDKLLITRFANACHDMGEESFL